MMTTPKEIGKTVEDLATKYGLTETPLRLKVETRSDAIVDDCYMDVEKQIQEFGGEIVYGWQLWEWSKILIEGEFHAVWKSPDGKLIDVSYKRDGEKDIVFIPDPTRKYEKRQIDNIRLALWNHTLVHEFIEVNKAIHKEFDDNRTGELEASVDANKMMELEMRKAQLQSKLMSFPRGKSKK